MNDVTDIILPESLSTTALEETHDRVAAERFDLPVPLRDLVRPGEIRADLLPWLAWALSTDLWDDSWPVEKKRFVVAQWFDLHRYKGTEWGITRAIEIMGGRVVRIVTPPQRMAYDRGMTEAERSAWLALLPQLRVYPYAPRNETPGPVLQWSHRRRVAWSRAAWNSSLTLERYRRLARLHDPADGSFQDLSYREVRRQAAFGTVVDYDEIVLPAEDNRTWHWGRRAWSRGVWGRSSINERVFRHRIERQYQFARGQLQDRSIRPSLDPITVAPELVSEAGTGPRAAMFFGRRAWRSVTWRNEAWRRVYERTYLHDPTRLVSIRRGRTFWGHARYGMAPHTAEITVDVSCRRAGAYRRLWYGGFWMPTDRAKLDRVRQAVAVSMALHDRILIQSKTHKIVTFGDRQLLSGRRFGDRIPV